MRIGIVDADLLDKGTRFPNLVCMKLSAYHKHCGHNVDLLLDYNNVKDYDKVYIVKVFSKTSVPIDLAQPNIEYNGTGFFYDNAVPLPSRIEHTMPDYTLYETWLQNNVVSKNTRSYYEDYSIGYTTRGCFRHCSWCVNRNSDEVMVNSPVSEFLNKKRKRISMLDDNVLGYTRWEKVFEDLQSTGKYFVFRQGLDLRCLTEHKAEVLAESKYYKDYIFAFDDEKDETAIRQKLKLWRSYSHKGTKLYTLTAFKSICVNDIDNLFKRFWILAEYQCVPYVMRFEGWERSEHRGMYITIARWAIQQKFYKKMSFREFCEADIKAPSALGYLRKFEKKYPEIAKKHFDRRYSDFSCL